MSARRSSNARLSFGKSLSKSSLKDSKSSVNSSDSGGAPIPRTKSQGPRSKKKGSSPPLGGKRLSTMSQHMDPLPLNYECAGEPPPPIRDSLILKRVSSPPLTVADVSLPLRREDHDEVKPQLNT